MTAPRKLVVVCEDDLEIGELIACTLRDYDFEVVHVTRGADLLEQVKTSRPVACVIDLGLQLIDSFAQDDAPARAAPEM